VGHHSAPGLSGEEVRLPSIKKKPIGKFRGLNDIDTLYREVQRAYSLPRQGEGKEGSGVQEVKVPRLLLSERTVLSQRSPNVLGVST
jgi:hypothetical protein